MNIGELDGVKIVLSPEGYAGVKKQKLIEENKILNDLQEQLDKYKNVFDKIKEYIEKNVICMKNGKLLTELDVNKILELLEEVK